MDFRKKQTLACLFLAASMLLALAACGKSDPSGDGRFPNRYSASHHPVTQADSARCAAFDEDTVFFIAEEGHSISGAEGDFVEILDGLYSADQDGAITRCEAFSDYQRQRYEQGFSNHRVECLATGGNDSLWMVTQSSQYTENGPGPLVWTLLQLDKQGNVLNQAGLTGEFPFQLTCDKEGFTYVLGNEKTLQLFDSDGKKTGQLGNLKTTDPALVTLADGRAAAIGRDGDNYLIQPIDMENKAFGETALLENSFGTTRLSFYTGGDGYDLLCNTGISLYGYHLGSGDQPGTGEQLLTWLNCDVEGPSILALTKQRNGFACLFNSNIFGGELVQLREKAPAAAERTLTLACRGLTDGVSQTVLRFNRQDTGCRIIVKDYGGLAVAGQNAGVDKMTADMISNKMPDLICTDNVNVQTFLDQNLLEDLWPYIDADTELGGREGLVQPVFNALRQDGKLYQVADGFTVNTAMGLTARMGDRQGWTLEDFQQFLDGLEEDVTVYSPQTANRLQIMWTLTRWNTETLIRRDGSDESFDSQRYIAMMEYANRFPPEPKEISYEEEMERLQTGKQLLTSFILTNPLDINRFTQAYFGGQSTILTGIPGVEGNGSGFFVRNPMAMYAGCENKEDAWSFLRTLPLPESQRMKSVWTPQGSFSNQGMPTNKAAFDAMMEETKAWPEKWSLDIAPMTTEQIAQFETFLEGITLADQENSMLAIILNEEAQRYFDGLQTPEQAAASAQSRINLYLGERKK